MPRCRAPRRPHSVRAAGVRPGEPQHHFTADFTALLRVLEQNPHRPRAVSARHVRVRPSGRLGETSPTAHTSGSSPPALPGPVPRAAEREPCGTDLFAVGAARQHETVLPVMQVQPLLREGLAPLPAEDAQTGTEQKPQAQARGSSRNARARPGRGSVGGQPARAW